jgi:hypothetical protein
MVASPFFALFFFMAVFVAVSVPVGAFVGAMGFAVIAVARRWGRGRSAGRA